MFQPPAITPDPIVGRARQTESLSSYLARNNLLGAHGERFVREKIALPAGNGKRVMISRARAWLTYREAGLSETKALSNLLPAYLRVRS